MTAKTQQRLVRLWHAVLVGGFTVAYLTGDEDTYSMHLFTGWLVVGLVALRICLPLPLTRPNRPRFFNWSIVAVFAMAGAAALSGVGADMLPWLEDPHEGLAEASLWVALAHVAAALVVFKGRRWLARLKTPAVVGGLMLALVASQAALAADAARDAILAVYAQQAQSENPAFAGFSAQRGEALYRSKNTANPDAASCAACHTEDPARAGRHVKTGRVIEPVAVSANPKRFTDAEKVEERFIRDCKSILGRACSATEKGDYVTFMASR